MSIPKRQQIPTQTTGLDWVITDDGSRTLIEESVGQSFHSGCGAISEGLVVYLLNSGIADNLVGGRPSRVLELGFGTGTNFFLTAALAEALACPLRYYAFDLRLLATEIYRNLQLDVAMAGQTISNVLQAAKAPNILGSAKFRAALSLLQTSFVDWVDSNPKQMSFGNAIQLSPHVCLHLQLEDFNSYCNRSLAHQDPLKGMDAFYFDAFSPEANPELWNASNFRFAHSILQPGGTLTSYCVKREVRDTLESAGFSVLRKPGPLGGKREVLLARR